MAVQQAAAEASPQAEYVLYPARFAMLAIFSTLSFGNSFSWIQLSAVTDITESHFEASNTAVNWLSMVFMAAYVPLALPAAGYLEKYGLRRSLIAGSTLHAAGALMRAIAGANRSLTLLVLGQTTCSIAQNFILGVPPVLAAKWFGVAERASASGVAVIANQFGAAVGLFMTTVVRDEHDLQGMLWATCFLALASAVLITLGFRSTPPTPPSATQARYGQLHQEEASLERSSGASNPILDAASEAAPAAATTGNESLPLLAAAEEQPAGKGAAGGCRSVSNEHAFVGGGAEHGGGDKGEGMSAMALASNWDFMLTLVSYSCSTGVYYTIATLMTGLMEPTFGRSSSSATEIGWMGFTMVTLGIPGILAAGMIIDRTMQHTRVIKAFYVVAVLSLLGFAFADRGGYFGWTFACMSVFGFFQTGVLSSGLELGAELAHPVPETLSTVMLNIAAQAAGVIFISLVQPIFLRRLDDDDRSGPFAANLTFAGIVAAGFGTLCMSSGRLKRLQEETPPAAA